MTTLPIVEACTTTACSYNQGGCTAAAVTIAGSTGSASCGTFISLDARGGLPGAKSQIGACQRLECAHNKDLMCTAESVSIGGDTALCESYTID